MNDIESNEFWRGALGECSEMHFLPLFSRYAFARFLFESAQENKERRKRKRNKGNYSSSFFIFTYKMDAILKKCKFICKFISNCSSVPFVRRANAVKALRQSALALGS